VNTPMSVHAGRCRAKRRPPRSDRGAESSQGHRPDRCAADRGEPVLPHRAGRPGRHRAGAATPHVRPWPAVATDARCWPVGASHERCGGIRVLGPWPGARRRRPRSCRPTEAGTTTAGAPCVAPQPGQRARRGRTTRSGASSRRTRRRTAGDHGLSGPRQPGQVSRPAARSRSAWSALTTMITKGGSSREPRALPITSVRPRGHLALRLPTSDHPQGTNDSETAGRHGEREPTASRCSWPRCRASCSRWRGTRSSTGDRTDAHRQPRDGSVRPPSSCRPTVQGQVTQGRGARW
jgi:hypothetical protein